MRAACLILAVAAGACTQPPAPTATRAAAAAPYPELLPFEELVLPDAVADPAPDVEARAAALRARAAALRARPL